METYVRSKDAEGEDSFDTAEMDADIVEFANFVNSDLRELVNIVQESKYSHLKFDTDDVAVKIKKRYGVPPKPSPSGIVEKSLKPIVSRYLGVLHLNDERGVPYVKVGDKIKKGQVLATVETMNIFNDVKASVEGKLVEILEKDGNPVEYGQILFFVEV